MKKTTAKARIPKATSKAKTAKVKNYVFPTELNKSKEKVEKDLRNYITPVQLQRVRHDVQMWRDAVIEAESAYFPHRVRMQRMYIDTILSGHTLACVNRRKELTLLRDYEFKIGEEKDEATTELFKKSWFNKLIEYVLDAKFYGYTLIALNDMVDGAFPKITIIRRANISPDRLNVTSYIYSISGAQFLDEPYLDWHVWVPTPTEIGVSDCGYGLLYSVAIYEILCRNLLGYNSDAAELYGMPSRIGTTSKTDELERGQFEAALRDMGSAGYILKDIQDDVELLETKGNGQGFKIYPDLEKRLESKISKIVLGHSDALDSTPGKLGGNQGGEESAQALALRDKQTSDGSFVEDIINSVVIPKLRVLGFTIADKAVFKFSNNQELAEIRQREDASNKVTADIAYVMKQAGLKMDAAYFEERTGIKTTEAEEVEATGSIPFNADVKNRLKKLYGA